MLTTRPTARAVALLAAAVLGVGLGPPPSTAGATAGATAAATRAVSAPERDLGLRWSDVRGLAADVRAGATPGGAADRRVPRRTAVVVDPRGDSRREGGAARPRPHTRLADLTRVLYRTPSRVDGDLRLRGTWADHVDASVRGVRRQYLLTFLFSPSSDDFWVTWVGNAQDRVQVFRVTERGQQRLTPERADVDRTFGEGGTTTVTLSTEWLGTRRVGLGTLGLSGWAEEAFDETDLAPVLRVGPLP